MINSLEPNITIMKFQGSLEINQSIEVVTSLFADPEAIGDYQEGFEKKVLEKGHHGEAGAVSKLYYKNGSHEMVLTETVLSNELPDSFEAFYHHKHMDNTMKCNFIALDNSKTRYEIYVEYTRIDWLLPRLFAILFPGMYKKPAKRWMENFKLLAEAQTK